MPETTSLEAVAEVAASLLLGHADPANPAGAERSRTFAAALEHGGGITALLDAARAESGLRAWLVTGGATFAATGELAPADSELRGLADTLAGQREVGEVNLAAGPAAALALGARGAARVGRARGHVLVETRYGEGHGQAQRSSRARGIRERASLLRRAPARGSAAWRPRGSAAPRRGRLEG